MGVVIRDATGTVTAACCKYLQGQYSVEEVEALAIECGLLLAREQKLPQIIVEYDALTAVQSITAAETNGSLGHVYQGILNLLSSFSSRRIKHVKRDTQGKMKFLKSGRGPVLLWCNTLSRQIVFRIVLCRASFLFALLYSLFFWQ